MRLFSLAHRPMCHGYEIRCHMIPFCRVFPGVSCLFFFARSNLSSLSLLYDPPVCYSGRTRSHLQIQALLPQLSDVFFPFSPQRRRRGFDPRHDEPSFPIGLQAHLAVSAFPGQIGHRRLSMGALWSSSPRSVAARRLSRARRFNHSGLVAVAACSRRK